MSIRLSYGLPGEGTLALIGGGEFSFGDTLEADRAWLDRTGDGPIGFVPAASGSDDYGRHFAEYMEQTFDRKAETVPIYRPRDARRGKNAERLAGCSAIYLGGGVADHLLDTLIDSPALTGILERLRSGGVVVAIAAAAQALGRTARSLTGGEALPGLGWLDGAVIEPNFDPGHDRRLRWLLEQPGVDLGVGLPARSALIFSPEGSVETIGPIFVLDSADGDLAVAGSPLEDAADGMEEEAEEE